MAGSRKTILRNSLIISIGAILGNVSSFAFRTIIARAYGPDQFGVFSIGLMVVTISASICLVGLPAGITKFVSEYRSEGNDDRIPGMMGISLGITLALGILITLFLVLEGRFWASDLFDSPQSEEFLKWFSLQIPAHIIILLSGAFVLGYERGSLNVAIREFVPKVAILSFTLALVASGASVYGVGIGYALGKWVAAAFGLAIVYLLLAEGSNSLWPGSHFSRDAVKIFTYSVPLLFTTLSQSFLNWMDTFFIAIYLSDYHVGIYQAAFIIAMALGLFSKAISQSLFPNFSGLLAENKIDEVSSRYADAIQWGLVITVAPFVYLLVFPRTSLGMIFGADYSAAWTSLLIIAAGQVFSIVCGPYVALVKSNGDTKFILYTYILAAGINILGNVLLIPIFGITGAALSASLAAAIQAVFLFSKSRAIVPIRVPIARVGRISLSGGLTGLLFYSLTPPLDSQIWFLTSIVLFTVVYAASTILTGAIRFQEVKSIVNAA
jgi:O-antigen/teichoic acid export membrane protein